MFALKAKSFAIAILVSLFLFFLLVSFSGRTSKSVFVNVLTLVTKKACDQYLTHSLHTLKNIFLEIIPQVVVHGACGT